MVRAESKRPWMTWAVLAALICLVVNYEVDGLASYMGNEGEVLHVCGIIASLSLWGLPLFAMLIGNYFFTGKYNRSIRTLWMRVIPTAIISCGFWWILSAVIQMQQNYANETDLPTFLQCMGEVLEAPANIRFLHVMCSAFILYPLLQRIARNPDVTRYCLVVLFAITLVEPQIRSIPYGKTVTLFLDQLNWGFFRAWGFYILLGAYLENRTFTWQERLAAYVLGILSAGAVFYLDHAVYPNAQYMDFDSPFSAFQAIAVAMLIHQTASKRTIPGKFLCVETMWIYVPTIFVADAISGRLPIPENNIWLLLVFRIIAITLLSVIIVYVLEKLKGFRKLVGYLDDIEEVQG